MIQKETRVCSELLINECHGWCHYWCMKAADLVKVLPLTYFHDWSCFHAMGWDLLYDWASCDWNYRHISMTDHVFRLWAEIYCVTGLHGNWNCWLISMTDLVFRLWAEIYCVTGRGDYMQWKRLSDEVVPINITCVEDTPKTVFLVTAYNKHVEKILDIKIIQPGIYLCN